MIANRLADQTECNKPFQKLLSFCQTACGHSSYDSGFYIRNLRSQNPIFREKNPPFRLQYNKTTPDTEVNRSKCRCTLSMQTISLYENKFKYSNKTILCVLLTAHLGIIFVNKATRYTIFLICLFLFSICFGQPCAHHQEN
jgi:hypothetical protein